jgi:tetratricopeptide (TPR) repeat protein
MNYKLRKALPVLAFIAYSLSFIVSNAQSRVDSLNVRLKQEAEDTNKVRTLYELAGDLDIQGDLHKADSVGNMALTLARKLNYKSGIMDVLGMLGIVYKDMGNYQDALRAHTEALQLAQELGSKADELRNLSNIGVVYYTQGEYPKALEYDFNALKAARAAGNKRLEANNLSNLGLVYWADNEYQKAIDFCDSAVTIYNQISDKGGIARNTGNIGVIYYNMHNYPKAHEYLEKALHMNEELGRKGGVIRNTNNIGNIYDDEGDYEKAIEYYRRGLDMSQQLGDRADVAISLGDIGASYYKQKKYSDADEYLNKALDVAKEIKSLEMIKSYNQQLSDLYYATGKYDKALDALKKYNDAKDSLVNEEKSKQIGKLEAKAEYDKQLALQQADNEKKKALAVAESIRQKEIIVFVAAIALAVAFIALIIFRSLKTTRQQKATIEKQKALVEEQKAIVDERNEAILDSIIYAKQLQDAILPPLEDVETLFPESFILYKPKDIVAGDFYWMYSFPLPVGEGRGEVTFIAACDCTGHGVPGAMVSVVCSNALDRAVKEFGITEPGKILDKVRELVIETFGKNEGEIKDGMDITLASITIPSVIARNEARLNDQVGQAISGADKRLPRPDDGSRSDVTVQLNWAGANRPLFIISTQQGKSEIKELLPDKQPIGSYEINKPFSTHTVPLSKGDCIYLYTDGLGDQFGGPKGKKFKSKQVEQMLAGNAHLPMKEQKHVIETTFERWKGALDQTDDICVIGVRI